MKPTPLIACGLLAAAVMMAQTHHGPPPHELHGPPPIHGPFGPPGTFGGGIFESIEGPTVTGAPFTAQIVSNSTQTLSDGSHIARTVNAAVARDSQGRTYRQQNIGNPESPGATRTVVFLRDPVAGTSHLVAHDTKTAVLYRLPERLHGPREGPRFPGREHEGRPMHTRDNENSETLGPQLMEGVWAEGTRITRTIPVGAIGNDHELKIVSETWYSKDLQMVMMSRHSDPRTGESTFRVTNIQRAEPDPSLFQVPAGYKVTEGHRGHP